MTDHDVVVVGGGMAGSTAALFAARHGLTTVVLNNGLPGGQLLNISRIEDYPGFTDPVAGFELCPSVQEQALAAGAEFEMAEATDLIRIDEGWNVVTAAGKIASKTVIVATGSEPRSLGLDGEQALTGRGVSHCASCDGPLYRGQSVAVVGGGDSALQESLELTDHVERVTIIHRSSSFSGQASYQTRVTDLDVIDVRFNTEVTGLIGDTVLEGIAIRKTDTGDEQKLEVGGLFVYIGSEPNVDCIPEGIQRDHHGRVHTDVQMRTSLEGVFAAGDIRAGSSGQAVSSAGDGAAAAVSAFRYIAGEVWPVADSPGVS